MQITFNGEPRELPEGLTIEGFLRELQLPVRGVAVEVNLEVVPRQRHGDTVLRDGDRIEVVTLVGGG